MYSVGLLGSRLSTRSPINVPMLLWILPHQLLLARPGILHRLHEWMTAYGNPPSYRLQPGRVPATYLSSSSYGKALAPQSRRSNSFDLGIDVIAFASSEISSLSCQLP